jgi:hypothetical protein
MNDFPFYVMWVGGLEEMITTSMSRLSVHYDGQVWTTLHNKNIQERECIIGPNFHSEFGGSSDVMLKKFL